MPHYVALLRGINLGKRRLKMERLRELFEELGFTQVATFIASGNVLFASRVADPRKLGQRIAAHLEKSLGYEVDTFIRTRAEVAAVAAYPAFPVADLAAPENTIFANFLHEPLSDEQHRSLLACRTDVDEFAVAGREFYWLCRIRSSESTVWASTAMKAVRLPARSTMRNLTTLRKIAEQYPAPT